MQLLSFDVLRTPNKL